ncbi:MAG: hypothetical protein NTZ21_04255 [Actinobacteria bacterium]|nr:hypothetical protein [Actinomycetota bacterium]
MNHDPLDPQTPDEDLLAVSALLDGTATADDEARVDADPALRELLDIWRDQRTALADVAAPAGAREDALAAAMSVFDRLQSEQHDQRVEDDDTVAPVVNITPAGTAPAPGNVIRFERRRRTYRLLTGAAAAVGVLFVGALVVGGLGSMGGSDEESTAIAPEAAAKSPTPDASRVADDPATPMMESAEAAPMGDAAGGAGETGDGAFSTAAPAATESAAASEITEAPAATDAPAPENSADTISGAADLVVTITTPQALLDYANTRQAILPLPGLAFPCVAEGDQAVGEVSYQGTPAVVVRDPGTGEVTALDLDGGCAVLATVTP